ncbi:MAG: NAD+ synthase [Culturomica sp.]|jgi:NAD+ synthase (glutamine-hydrolysing)|nr:NAD+ synthase [Culturomica sp.]
MKIAIPQLNYYAGDIDKNYVIISKAIAKAKEQNADLIVFPELAICGTFPEDLLEREQYAKDCMNAVIAISKECEEIAAIVGAPNLDEEGMYNSAFFMQNGIITDEVRKTVFSDYDIYDDNRYFAEGELENSKPIILKKQHLRILFDEYEEELIQKQDDLVIYIANPPFTKDLLTYKEHFLSEIAKNHSKPVISVNRCGANTSLVFHGDSSVYNKNGERIYKLRSFDEDFMIVDTEKINESAPLKRAGKQASNIEVIYKALKSGLKDFFAKNKFEKAVVGLSGGIDSSVVAALAVEVLGKDNVWGILMPSEFSTDHSVKDAEDLAKNLGIKHNILPIKTIYNEFMYSLETLFKGLPFNVAEENLQARIRGTLLFTLSNKFGNIVLNTSNKSEAAVGYGTLYGDLCGSLCVIGDIYKTEVYELAQHINRNGVIIPANSITKAPSAELHPDQKDQDSLPDYDVLDKILYDYLEEGLSEENLIIKGYNKDTVFEVVSLIAKNEYKRAQCPPAIKVSKKAFGSGRRIPF